MAANSDGCILTTTIVTFEGNLTDSNFKEKLDNHLAKLNNIVGDVVKVRKLEPWNSVRVTLSIPREAALRLRKLASEGSAQLRALGILSVQVEGDQVISLRIAANSVNSEPQEIILQTAQDGSGSSRPDGADGALSRFLSSGNIPSIPSGTATESSEKVHFKSPNVVCPSDSVVPKVPISVSSNTSNIPSTTAKGYGGPFPFTSMNQAIHSREGLTAAANYTIPPPPYPGKPPIQQQAPPPPPLPAPSMVTTISSPLLVNLLQNDGPSAPQKAQKSPDITAVVTTPPSAVLKPPLSNLSSNLSNRTIPQNVYVQKSSSGLINVVQEHSKGTPPPPPPPPPPTVRTVVNTNRTIPNATAFVQKPTTTTISNNSLPPPPQQRLLGNSLESDVALNTNNKLNLNQVSQKPGSPIHVSQASTSSPSALLNTSSIRQNNKLLSTTITPPNTNNHLRYPINNNSNNNHIQQNLLANLPVTQPPISNLTPQQQQQLPIPTRNPIATVPPPPHANTRILPPPPPYSVAVNNRPWDSIVQTSPFLDLTPSLTDLKADDLEDLLPTLERDLARSPPEIPEELTRSEEKKNFLINPLTGELEPQSSGESDNEELADVFTGLPSPAAVSDEDTNSTIRPDTTDQSDSETRSSHSDSGKHSRIKSNKIKDKGRDSPAMKPTEKIKLRLKLEKSEPINSAYKVDVRFIQQQPKKASTSVMPSNEELRVPPLHISLRGRHPAFITSKKKNKLNPDGTLAKPKARKEFAGKLKKSSEISAIDESPNNTSTLLNDPNDKNKFMANSDQRKIKKFKPNHEHNKEILPGSLLQESDLRSKLVIHNPSATHYKEKQKERRGSDSELARANLKFVDSNGIISIEKKRRLSQSEVNSDAERPTVLGSTNVGTITSLPQKSRKDKTKLKDGNLKSNKDLVRSKSFAKNLSEKFNPSKQVTLPTGEIDMEAKFKQRLLEDSEKGIPRPPHRTETVHQVITENTDKILKVDSELPPLKDKSPEPDKCNTPDRKQADLGDKQSGRSPNSGAQGEDSGIESMDALSEKSPNQASQSPHADIPEPINKSKTQVPDMLDIEAQLAKMEGLNGIEDVNDNQHNNQTKLGQCCELTSALQDSLKQGAVSLSVNTNPSPVKEQIPQTEVSLMPLKTKIKEEDLEPLPVRMTPPLYTYSNPDKGRGSESPPLSDEDSNSNCSNNIHKSKSLLEQLLIEIPENQTSSSPSPATRSVRTRALSKLSSPELNSPIAVNVKQQQRAVTPVSTTISTIGTPPTSISTINSTNCTSTTIMTAAVTTAIITTTSAIAGTTNSGVGSTSTTCVAVPMKRKRHESDSSNNGLEDQRNNKKSRKCSENASELIKACIGVDQSKLNNVSKKTGATAVVTAALTPATTTSVAVTAVLPSNVAISTTATTTTGPTVGKLQDESSDSDEPLIEKIKKTSSTATTTANNSVGKKVKTGNNVVKNIQPVSTRRSVRTAIPAPNTRSKGDKTHSESEALRRKTRSAVSDGETKRKKEVK